MAGVTLRGRLAASALALAMGLVACAAPVPSSLDSAGALVASPGEILVPPCADDAGCQVGFVVGRTLYGVSCYGVDPSAVDDEVLARGSDLEFAEVRAIDGLPVELWVAVRGPEMPCRPGQDQPLLYDWYLAHGDAKPSDLEKWGEAASAITLPIDP